MTQALRDLWQRRELLYLLTRRDIAIRYKQSILGVLWALLMPAILVAAGIVLRIIVSDGNRAEAADISVVVVKAIPWMFFVTSIRFSTSSLTMNSNLVAKLAFPKEVFPIAAVLACGVDLLAAAAVALPLLLIFGNISIGLQNLWALPLIATLGVFTIGLGLLLSAGNLFFRDVRYIVEVMLSFAIFFTPVLYDAASLGRYAKFAMLNPIAPLLEGFGASVVGGRAPHLGWAGYSLAISLLVLVGGYWAFKRMEYLFAERV